MAKECSNGKRCAPGYNNAGPDKDATEVAVKIQKTVDYVVSSCGKTIVAQKEFVEAMRQNREE